MNKYTKTILAALALCGIGFIVYLVGFHRHETPDMSLAEVHGPVKSIQIKSYASDKDGNIINDTATWNNRLFEFDNAGMMTKGQINDVPGENTQIRLHRNNKAQIEYLQVYLPAYDAWFDVHFTYNQEQRVVTSEAHGPDGVSSTTYTYDDDGNVITEKEITIKGEPYIGITSYRILETDHHDNWTRALVTTDYNISGEKTREYRIDVRDIEYY